MFKVIAFLDWFYTFLKTKTESPKTIIRQLRWTVHFQWFIYCSFSKYYLSPTLKEVWKMNYKYCYSKWTWLYFQNVLVFINFHRKRTVRVLLVNCSHLFIVCVSTILSVSKSNKTVLLLQSLRQSNSPSNRRDIAAEILKHRPVKFGNQFNTDIIYFHIHSSN